MPGCGSKRQCAPAVPLLVEAHFSMRPFTFRQRGLVFRLVPAAGSTLPAYIFKAILKFPLARSIFGSRPRPAFSWPDEARSAPQTRCQFLLQDSPLVFRHSLPFRTFRSFRIKAPCRNPTGEAYLCRHPDLPSLPVPRKPFRIAAKRIKVPDPLLPARLAVPRTSWNHVHDEPVIFQGQY